MSEVFQPLTQAQREEWQARYLTFLQHRDGTPNFAGRSFDVREKFFEDIDTRPIRWEGKALVDAEVFTRNHLRYQPEKGLDEATLWALTVSKVNRSERFGIEYNLDRRKPTANDAKDPYLYAGIEEMYHTRILRDVIGLLGLDMQMQPPPLFTRWIIKAMSLFPKSMANILVLNGEIGGVVIFKKLLEKGRELLSSQPKVWARAKELFEQILIDEIGHVYFLRSTLDASRLALAKRLLPSMVSRMLDDLPEASLLFGKEKLVKEISEASIDDIAKEFAPSLRMVH